MLNDIFKDLKLKNAFTCEDTEIRNSINKFCTGEILIIFKSDYGFKTIPESFIKLGSHLFYKIPIEKYILSSKTYTEIVDSLDSLIDKT